jgi:hypothetical protein
LSRRCSRGPPRALARPDGQGTTSRQEAAGGFFIAK